MKKPAKEPVKKPMKISFCTTCMGRTEHLKETLIKNIEDNLPKNPGDPQVEFVVVDYNSPDGLKEWFEDSEDSAELQKYIAEGTLVYRQYPEAKKFHHSHAKNMSHRVAAENTDQAKVEHIVCNVDADNFLGEGFARSLADKFADGTHAIVHPAYSVLDELQDELKGCFGRIAMRCEDFLALGGYTEKRFQKGWGGEDLNIIRRALAYRLEPRLIFEKEFLNVIAHSNKLRVVNTEGGTTEQEIDKVYAGGLNLSLLFKQIKNDFETHASSVQANRHRRSGMFGMGRLLMLDGTEQVLGAIRPFRHILRRGFHAGKGMKIDKAMMPPQKTQLTL